MRPLFRVAGLTAAALGVAAAPAAAADHKVNVHQAAGLSQAAIQSNVDAYRADLGQLNPFNPGSVGSGRREINWDGGGDAPNTNFPGDGFNQPTPGLARGAEFKTPGKRFEISGRAAGGPIEFDNLNASYSKIFRTFSAEKLFTAVGSTITDVKFFVPGTKKPAYTKGFGAVFTDVDKYGSTKMTYYDKWGTSLGTYVVPASPGKETLSFLGVKFHDKKVARVRIQSGDTAPPATEAAGKDVVVMDDFIYGEPTP